MTTSSLDPANAATTCEMTDRVDEVGSDWPTPTASAGKADPARCNAWVTSLHSRTGALSAASIETQGTRRRGETTHWATSVVLPYLTGAAISVSGRWAARSITSIR